LIELILRSGQDSVVSPLPFFEFPNVTPLAIMSARPPHVRSPSLDTKAIEKLEKDLNARPTKNELVERNILKDDRVAPALQAAKEKLQRSQLEDKLDQALQQRPKVEELIKEGILKDDEMPGV